MGKLVKIDFKKRQLIQQEKDFSIEMFEKFWHDYEKPIEKQLYDVVKRRCDLSMNIGEFMVSLKYNPYIRGMGWEYVKKLFDHHPQKDEIITVSKEMFGGSI